MEDLYSTHANHFKGVSATINEKFSQLFSAGIGIEYSAAAKHEDNGWNLYQLHFLPIYVNQYFNLPYLKNISTFIHLQEGISFINYDKEFQASLGPRNHIKETGFYGYSGIGINYPFAASFGLIGEAGLKSFHLSSNEWAVNPHGFTGKLGLSYRIK